jgi:hypothetical protein
MPTLTLKQIVQPIHLEISFSFVGDLFAAKAAATLLRRSAMMRPTQ